MYFIICPFILIDLSFSKSSKEEEENSKDERKYCITIYHLTSIQIDEYIDGMLIDFSDGQNKYLY